MSNYNPIACQQTSQPAQTETPHQLGNPQLPARRTDLRAMSPEEYRRYKDGIKRILCSAAESDEVRRLAFEMLLEADRILWPNKVANRVYWKSEQELTCR